MQNHWLRHSGNDRVIVFVLGWSCDHGCVEHIADSIPNDYDIACTYDYRNADSLSDQQTGSAPQIDNQSKTDNETQCFVEQISAYRHRYLVAWSFGVWAAEQLFTGMTFDRAVAFCGSPHPVSSEFGIEPKRLLITIKGLAKYGSEEFNRRTYGTFYEQIQSRLTPRDAESNVEELATLNRASSAPYTPTIDWNRAIIGRDDVIFPTENLLRYWGIRAQVLPLPHYPFENAQLIIEELDIR